MVPPSSQNKIYDLFQQWNCQEINPNLNIIINNIISTILMKTITLDRIRKSIQQI